jgi:hypothetical protein
VPLEMAAAAGVGGEGKKRGASRSWILFDAAGEERVLDADKYTIMHRVDINARDLRILDPLLSYPSTILGRERAIVLNLEVRVPDPRLWVVQLLFGEPVLSIIMSVLFSYCSIVFSNYGFFGRIFSSTMAVYSQMMLFS